MEYIRLILFIVILIVNTLYTLNWSIIDAFVQ